MIGLLRGQVVSQSPPYLVMDVNGVGYELQAPMTTFYQLADPEQLLQLYTHLVVREDAQLLYGFIDVKERDLFRVLIKINGVGPKLALSILSALEMGEFLAAVADGAPGRLVKIPGVGKKTAERLVIECQGRVKDFAATAHSMPSASTSADTASLVRREAQDALEALGYKVQEAERAIERCYQPGHTAPVLIRTALQQMLG